MNTKNEAENQVQYSFTQSEINVAFLHVSRVALNICTGKVKTEYEGTPLATLTEKLRKAQNVF